MLSITVDTLVDENDGLGVGGISLREAILHANAYGNQINFAPSLEGGTISLGDQLTISNSVEILGPGADQLTIAADGSHRVFKVELGAAATISGVTISGGGGVQYGAGVWNSGNLTLSQVIVSNNASTVGGGGVHSDGPSLQIIDSTVSHNRSGWGGGVRGDLAGNEWIYIHESTISNNVAHDDRPDVTGHGGGVYIGATAAPTGAHLNLTNTTVSGNQAEGQGGGVYLGSQARGYFRQDTITQNVADYADGGISNVGEPGLLWNTIIAGNQAGDAARADGYGPLGGYSTYVSRGNLVGVNHTSLGLLPANLNQLGNITDPLDPKLSPLGSFGGLTKTHLPLPQSLAIDHGANGVAGGLATDQRGSNRFVEDITADNAPSNNVDIGAVEGDVRIAVGDFNGDGRDDELRYSESLKSLVVFEGAANADGWEAEYWGSLSLEGLAAPSPSGANSVIVGDFNGDGRDDVMVRLEDYSWLLGISDGTQFHVNRLYNNDAPLGAGWQFAYVGDYDNDGDEELLGKVSNPGNPWVLVSHDESSGKSKATSLPSLSFTPGATVHIQDANRDGRDDLITRATSSSPWMVRLASTAADGSITFLAAADWTAWMNFGYDAEEVDAAKKLDADKAMAKVIEEFAWVYNNVELELYPGFMKGLTATEETKAANPWEQAALLVNRLENAGFEADIASGNVDVPIALLRDWLGVEVDTAVGNSTVLQIILNAFDGNAVAVDSAGTLAIRFRHAWARVKMPTSNGFDWVHVDPSWKFEDRQAGQIINLAATIPGYVPPTYGINGRVERGTFDELAFLANAGENQLPIEWYEDQLAAFLANTGRTSSLAEIAYDGPIKQKIFTDASNARGASQYAVGTVNTYPNFLAIIDNPIWKAELTHRMTVSLASGNTSETSNPVPLSPGYSLPDYTGLGATGATFVDVTSGITSYGQDLNSQSILFSDGVQPYLPLDGRLTDSLGTRTSISNLAGLNLFYQPDFQYFRTSGPSDYQSPAFPAQDADGTYRFVMGRASAAEFTLDPNYQFTSNTHIEFDIRQTYADASHQSTYDPILAIGYAVYDTNGAMIGQPSFALIDGRVNGEVDANPNVTPTATSVQDWKRFSIPISSPVTGQHRIFIIHADNEILDYRKQHGAFDTTALSASGLTTVRRVRFKEEGTGVISLNIGLPSPGPPYSYLEASLLGNSFKTQNVSPRIIQANTVLEFKFRSTLLGVAHYIGVDTDSDVDDSGAEALRPFAGTFTGLAIPAAYRMYASTDLNTEKLITISIGAEFPHLVGQQINKLVLGSMDDGHTATSNFREVRLIETDDYPYTIQGGDLVLNGESFQSVDMSYMIGPDTVLEFDYESTQEGAEHYIGWDIDDNPNTGAGNARALIPIYGTNSQITYP